MAPCRDQWTSQASMGHSGVVLALGRDCILFFMFSLIARGPGAIALAASGGTALAAWT